MVILLALIPVLVLISAMLVYQFNGKKEFIKFDLVQFSYAFLFAPIMFVWLKTFLYFLLRKELELRLSIGQLFLFDTIYSTIFLFLFAFIVIHSLTKSFDLKRYKDPLYDLFNDSEFFHHFFTHFIVYFGSGLLLSMFSLLNVMFPFQIEAPKTLLFSLISAGILAGCIAFIVTLLTEISANFDRLIKLVYGLLFLAHVVVYFILEPHFTAAYGMYWSMLIMLTTFVLLSLIFERIEKPKNIIEKLHYKMKLAISKK